jgi:hypothetical protein
MDGGLLLLAAILFGGKKKGSSKAHIATPQELLRRATQPRAAAWAPYFVDVGESPAVADAMARWAGIESGGDPRIVSSIGERGLLQVGRHDLPEGGISQRDWDALIDPDTTPNTDARIASQYWRWLFERASKHLDHPPTDALDQIWFAYLYHQRPKDFVEWGPLPGSAAAASAFLMNHIAGNPQLAKRIAATNIVGFATPDAPIS